MRVFRLVTLMAATVLPMASVLAEPFDGKQPLLCSAFRLFECDLADGCNPATAQELGTSSSWTVDFRKKEFTGTNPNALPNAIRHVELLDGKLFMTGVQDGLPDQRDGVAWSVSINNPDGVMTITAAGERVALVGLGSCVPQ